MKEAVMKKNLLIFTLATVMLYSVAFSQESLTLEQAVGVALEQNHVLRASSYELDAAKWGQRNAIMSWLPKVEVSAGLTRIDPQTVAQANAAVDFIKASAGSLGIPQTMLSNIKPFAYRDTYAASILAVQPIYNGGLEMIGIRAANALNDKGAYSLQEAEQDVIARVRIAYYNVLKSQALVGLTKESAERTKRWLDMTERRAALGQRTKTDVLRFKVQLAADEGNIVSAENYLAMSRIQLNELMGEDLNKVYALQDVVSLDSLIAESAEQKPQLLLASLQSVPAERVFDDSFLESHPSMKVMGTNLHLADINVGKAWTSFQPRVNLAFQYGWEKNNTIALDGIKPWAIALSASWPIFNSFSDYANLQKAEAELDRTKEQVESFRRGLLMQATNADLTLKAARKRIEIAREGLTEAEDVLSSVSRRYDLGSASNVDLIDVQTAYTSAKTSYISAVYDARIAEIELTRARGIVSR
jgi:outer membrane protein TolC